MTNPEPKVKANAVLQVLKRIIPAIMNTASEGLIKPAVVPDYVLFFENIPYAWILPKMHAIIQHGGSGTTHAVLKYGCAMMIVPHITDQHFWNDMVVRLQVGPKGLPINKLNEKDWNPGYWILCKMKLISKMPEK